MAKIGYFKCSWVDTDEYPKERLFAVTIYDSDGPINKTVTAFDEVDATAKALLKYTKQYPEGLDWDGVDVEEVPS